MAIIYFYFLLKKFLQCCVGFCHRTTLISHNYTYIPSLLPLSPLVLISLCVITEHQTGLPVLHSNFSPAIHLNMIVCVYIYIYIYIVVLLSPFVPFFPSPTVSTSPFSTSSPLFLPCKWVHQYNFPRFNTYVFSSGQLLSHV